MVKKAAAILVVFSIIITSLSFSVYADNDNVTQGNLTLQFSFSANNGSVSLDVYENSLVVFKTTPTTTETFPITIKSITWTNLSNQAPSNTFVSFKIAFAEACSSTPNHFIQTSNFGAINTELGSLYQIYDTTYDTSWYAANATDSDIRPNFKLLHQELFIKAQFKQPRTLSFNSTANFKQFPVSGSNTAYLYIIFYDVQILPNVSWFFSEMLGFQESILTQMLNLVDYTLSFLQRLTEQNNWTVTQDSYDSHGNFISSTAISTNWYTAIYQLLTNLYAPVRLQAEQEQQAKDAGAMEALDDAYEAADDAGSFWDLIPFIGFAGFGDYDDDAASDLGTGSITDWFSSTNQGWLENVPPPPKGNPDDFVDFYQQNLDDIEDLLGSEVSNSIRGSP